MSPPRKMRRFAGVQMSSTSRMSESISRPDGPSGMPTGRPTLMENPLRHPGMNSTVASSEAISRKGRPIEALPFIVSVSGSYVTLKLDMESDGTMSPVTTSIETRVFSPFGTTSSSACTLAMISGATPRLMYGLSFTPPDSMIISVPSISRGRFARLRL